MICMNMHTLYHVCGHNMHLVGFVPTETHMQLSSKNWSIMDTVHN